jgi:hypothetical protein
MLVFFLALGVFRGTCATQSPFLAKEGITCGYCGKTLGEGDPCGDPEKQETAMPAIKKA